jgi:hypothetical protein
MNKKNPQIQINENNDPYKNMLGRYIKDTSIQTFFRKLGLKYEYNDKLGPHFFIYKNKGVELGFNSRDTLEAIWFKNNEFDNLISLPYNLKMTDTRGDVETKLGKADKYIAFEYGRTFSAFYYSKALGIEYNSIDSTNLSNPIRVIHIDINVMRK